MFALCFLCFLKLPIHELSTLVGVNDLIIRKNLQICLHIRNITYIFSSEPDEGVQMTRNVEN